MSYAVESKKRKFHRVLESISKPLATDGASKLAAATSATATQDRAPANPSIKKVRLSTNDTSEFTSVRNSILKPSRTKTRTTSGASAERPTFVPWDRERFLERLETFRRVDRWTSKPSPINEVQWAKRGWICTDVMRVSCVSGCGGSVVVKLPEEIDELDGYDAEKVQERKEVRAKLVDEYEKRLSEGHGESCPWRNKACDATIQHLALTNTDAAISGLQSRYSNLTNMGDKLPAAHSIQTPEDFELGELIQNLPESWPSDSHVGREAEGPVDGDNQELNAQPGAGSSPTINHAALTMAFFGWDSEADGAAGLVGCKACFRRLGLWMYKPRENGDVTVYSSLDVATEHMDYCPWIDRLAQSGSGKPNEKLDSLRSGWEVVAEAIRVKHRRQKRSTKTVDTVRAESNTPPAQAHRDAIEENDETKKKADREWWAKIRRMRQVLTTKSPRQKSTNPK
ncbi:hypothetical protein N7462_010712 [Penicillium macrosclerotiorum]|uniref:uncharacterized protein n=1 Tax=Penicillium macrosclerotiorum TaxID=303699 RepID=UPI002548E5D6|nr:uncharacterized protein N7462_010712 [Penicillium macrosclerotiorum]KAJ5669642.1 hypothetical protein N7462_010712 [Penicillium macrosclerotiorum]